MNIDAFDFCNIKCNAGQIEDLLDKYEGVQPGYHMNKKHWISVYFDKDVPDKMIKDLVRKNCLYMKLLYLPWRDERRK